MAKKKNKTRDISGLGYSRWDFEYPTPDPNIRASTFGIYPTEAGLRQIQQTVMPISVASANQQMGMPINPLNPGTANAPAMMQGGGQISSSQLPAAAFLSPAEQQPVQDYLSDPDQVRVSSPVDTAKSWLSNLFDYEDEVKEVPGEAVWDGFLKGVDWFYDRINQVTAAGISGLPGGIETLTWDEAADVSVGQAFIGSMGAAAGRARRGEMTAGDFFTLPGTLLSTGLSFIDSTNAAQQADFDITDEADRKAAFSDSTSGRIASGTLDTAFTIFADPLIIGGKFLKVGRLRYLDRPIRTQEDIDRVTNNLKAGKVTLAGGDEGQISRMAPEALFANWVSTKAEDGTKVVSREEIFNHRVIRYATNRDGLTSALYNAENYDEAALILRSAAGDITAQAELMALRADLAVELGDAQRTLNFARFASNPAEKAKIEAQAQAAANKAADRVVELDNRLKSMDEADPLYRRTQQELERAKSQMRAANETYTFTASLDEAMIDPLNPVNFTADSADVARTAAKEMMRRDKYFSKAYAQASDETNHLFGTLMESNAGFSRAGRFGRAVERSRQGRATRAYQAAATRGARVVDEATGKTKRLGWRRDVFGNNGLSRGLALWRWAGEETPSGLVKTKGIGAQESTREVRAALNDIPIFSGEARTVTMRRQKKNKTTGQWEDVKDADGNVVMDTFEVGGVAAKERLIGRYMDALQDTTRGTEAGKLALDRIEEDVIRQISAWHGIDRVTAEEVLAIARSKRDSLVESIRNEGYWIDDLNGKRTINASPYLESQLQEGTFMLDFKTFEKRSRLWEETGWTKKRDTLGQGIREKSQNAYDFFNELWRPAVLMRLGYTQRNVFEGLVRASAFQFSLAPLNYAAMTGLYSLRNAWVKRNLGGWRGTQGAIEEATVALREARKTGGPAIMPEKFIKWKASQIVAQDKNIAENLTSIGLIGEELASTSAAAKDELLTFFMTKANDAADELVELRRTGAPAREIEVAQGKLDAMNDQIGRIRKIKVEPLETRGVTKALEQTRFLIQMDDFYRTQRSLLDNDLDAVALFRQQGQAKRRVFDGQFQITDYQTYQQAFDRNSPYSPIALMNLSADNTTKSMLSLRGDAMGTLLREKRMKYYVEVTPDKPEEYFNGVATAIRQFKNSEVGAMVVAGRHPDDIVKFLRETEEGREIAAFVTDAQVPKAGTKALAPVDYESTVAYVDELFRRWEQITVTPELRDYVRRTNIAMDPDGRTGFTGRVVETFLGERDASGNFALNLQPVVGNIAEEVGFKQVRDVWRQFTSWGMKWLGTIPEDAFVRAPFYGRRHQDTMKALVARVQEQTGDDFISARTLEQINNIAHRRALKDTKDWLYTIDRRTRLGRSGEYLFPFISAAQNSTTTIGRLIWRDPAIAGIGLAIWNAPNKIGMEDEQGNLVFALPLDMIPDSVKKGFGIDNILNIKVNKAGLNAILPETGFGLIPRMGPIGVAPASEMMKHGWFGMTVETPNIVKTILGDEAGDAFWRTWKDYVFGEERGLSSNVFSYDLFAPPVAQKLIQMIQGEGSSRQYAYYYNLRYREELANYVAGLRDTPPTAEEIQSTTNNFYWLRILGNLVAFTPPQYESNLEPLIGAIRAYDQEFGLDGSRMANQAFGNMLMMLGDFSTSKNVSGMPATAESVGAARRYSNIIRDLAPEFSQNGDMSVLSMLVNRDPNAFYDASAYSWQFSEQIPGVTDYFRELQNPEQALLESQKNAGWTEYISRMDYLDALLQQRGLTSFRQAGAEDLRQMKEQTIQAMKANPLYTGWYTDYEDFGSTRTMSALRLMERALSDQQFVADNQENEVWGAAAEYLQHRSVVLNALATRENGINHESNRDIRDYWDQARQGLINRVDGWGTFANRFLNGDEDPENLGVQFGVVYEVGPGGTNVNNAA